MHDRLSRVCREAALKEMAYQRVAPWTSKVDIFADFDYIAIPVHSGLHWSLIVVCHPDQFALRTGASALANAVMLHFDSLSHDTKAFSQDIAEWLAAEWRHRRGDTPLPAALNAVSWHRMNVPEQASFFSNSFRCCMRHAVAAHF